jgi:hypothetical protein
MSVCTKTKILGYYECSFKLLVLLVSHPDCAWYIFLQPMLSFSNRRWQQTCLDVLKGRCWYAFWCVVQYFETLATSGDLWVFSENAINLMVHFTGVITANHCMFPGKALLLTNIYHNCWNYHYKHNSFNVTVIIVSSPANSEFSLDKIH